MARVGKGECMGCSPGVEPMTLTRCHSYGLPQLYEALEEWKYFSSISLSEIFLLSKFQLRFFSNGVHPYYSIYFCSCIFFFNPVILLLSASSFIHYMS